MVFVDFVMIAVLLFLLLVLIAPWGLAVYCLIKKKKRLLIGAIVVILVQAALILFLASHSTYYKYNDWWIVGKTEAEIVERYGEFDLTWGDSKAYFIYEDNSWVMPDHLDHYYYIRFDETGIAIEVYDAVAPGG